MQIEEIIKKLANVRTIERRIPIKKFDPGAPPTPEDLEQAPLVTVGYRANCPAHLDHARSLTINKVPNHPMPSFHCSRGCTYGKIIKKLGLEEEFEQLQEKK